LVTNTVNDDHAPPCRQVDVHEFKRRLAELQKERQTLVANGASGGLIASTVELGEDFLQSHVQVLSPLSPLFLSTSSLHL